MVERIATKIMIGTVAITCVALSVATVYTVVNSICEDRKQKKKEEKTNG